MNAPAIRTLDAGEMTAAAALHARCFDEAWDEPALTRLVAAPGTFALGVGENPLAGFVLARIAAGEAEILTLAVDPASRGRGLGRRLMEAVAASALAGGATALFLEVAEDNDAARALYGRLGFDEVGRRPAYYARPDARVAALVLRLDLAAAAPS